MCLCMAVYQLMANFLSRRWLMPRRTFLRGLGSAMALPWLDAMASTTAATATRPASPKRLAFVYIPNGANMADWTPADAGADFAWPYILEPLEPWRDQVQVISGLAHDKARPNGDGPGDHARASATFLTGCQARKTAGADIRVGVSVDQIAAQQIGQETLLPSLELSCDQARQAGSCDSGYSCAYQFNIAWRTESVPMPPERNPRVVFERLFATPEAGVSTEDRARRTLFRKSVLDSVLVEANDLKRRLGAQDRRKLDEYLAAVRDVEGRIDRAEKCPPPEDFAAPEGMPDDYASHIRIMFDLLLLAFRTDSTRIATFLMAHDGSNRPYPFLGVPDGHHDLSHHGNDEEKKRKIALINRFHLEQFAYFLNRLRGTADGAGTLLDQCMIVYGGGIGDGNRHNHDNLPILLAGGGGGTLHGGRHLRLDKTPMTNLYLSLLDRLGVPADRVGDSTGRLEVI